MAADPSLGLVVGTLFLGLLASLFWPVTQHALTMAHEGSHAIFGSATGGRVTYMKLEANGNGETKVDGNGLITGLAGYVGPPLFGILGATLLANRVDPDGLLWGTFVLLVVAFLKIRNAFGWFIVLIFGFLTFMVGRFGTETGRTVFVYTLVWFLLLGGVAQNAIDNVTPGWSGDANLLRERYALRIGSWKLHVFPRGLWGLLFWLSTLVVFLYGAGIMLGIVDARFDGV